MYTSDDFPLLRTAFQRRWPLDDQTRVDILSDVCSAIKTSDDPKDKIQGLRVLLEIDRQELQAAQILINAKDALTRERESKRQMVGTPAEIAEGLVAMSEAVERTAPSILPMPGQAVVSDAPLEEIA